MSSASFQWKKFPFFDPAGSKLNLKENVSEEEEIKVTCASSGRGNIFVGDSKGSVWRLTKDSDGGKQLAITTHDPFQAWQTEAKELRQLRQKPYLIGLGKDDFVTVMKMWNIDKCDASGAPAPVRSDRLTRQGSQSEPVVVAVSENLQLLAVGYDDGGIVLHRGDVTKDRGQRVKVLREKVAEKGKPVTGMSFVTLESQTGGQIYLYVATADDIFMFNVTVRDKEKREVMDTRGCAPGLCVSPTDNLLANETRFVTGQQDAVYCYNTEGRTQCIPMEGEKKLLHWFRGYVAVVSDDTQKNKITIFDVQNRFIAFEKVKQVTAVVSEPEWDSIFLITQDGKISQFIEKDTPTKLQILIRRNLFDYATQIAKQHKLNEEVLIDIYRQHGDYYYEKKELPKAIDQYIKTIGYLEPSYVIQKFLEAQKIHNLTAYLQALHKEGRASEDHTTLLLNCYTKLKDKTKLDEFIMNKEGKEVDFDPDIAINVCRQAGYVEYALELAKKHKKHDLFLKITLENENIDNKYVKALEHIESLSLEDKDKQLKNYGSILVKKEPTRFTEILKDLIAKWEEPESMETKELKMVGSETMSSGTGPERSGGGVRGMKQKLDIRRRKEFDAEEYIHLFVNDQGAMVDFLEHLDNSGKQLDPSVYNTLLEYQLYAFVSAEGVESKRSYEEKIMDTIRKCNKDQALVLCQLNKFHRGLMYLYQQSGMYEQILKHYFTSGQTEQGIATCDTYGPQCPQLWVTALENIAAGEGADTTQLDQALVKKVLDNIEKHRLLSPLQVVSTLSSCPTATLGVVRDYLLRNFQTEDRAMQEHRKIIAEYEERSRVINEKLEKLSKAVEIRTTKCDYVHCGRPLDLPAIHFLCGCGFCEDCYKMNKDEEEEDACPNCAPKNKDIMIRLRSQENNRGQPGQHDKFHDQLEKAEDGFSIVAEYLGRGLFQPPAEKVSCPPLSAMDPTPAPSLFQGRTMPEDRPPANPASSNMSEGAIRAREPSQTPATAVPPPSKRLEESVLTAGYNTSLTAHMKISPGRHGGTLPLGGYSRGSALSSSPHGGRARVNSRASPVSRSPYNSLPRLENIKSKNPFPETQQGNPFGSPDSNESLGDDNPFAEKSSGSVPRKTRMSPKTNKDSGADNPFGEDDYDEEKNPFA